jgi:large subunit ribosomal protein L23
MSNIVVTDILKGPHISEKATLLAEGTNQITFKVHKAATKFKIKKAVESYFNVTVESVKVVNIKGKKKTFGGRQGKRIDVKKAYVRLKQGDDIDFEVAE